MASLTIEGIPKPVQVDPLFASLSPEDQARTVDEIRAAWNAQTTARKDEDTSALTGLVEGGKGVVRGIDRTIGLLGGDRKVAEVPESNYAPASADLRRAVDEWDIVGAAKAVPRFLVESAPGMATTMGGGAIGARIGSAAGPYGAIAGGVVGAGIGSALQNFGPTADERARNNNRTEVSNGDIAGAVGTTAATAAFDAVGARGGGSLLRQVLREGATEVPQDIIQQTGETLGTERGLDVDPARALAAGIGGAATRGAISAPGAAARSIGQSVARRGAERAMGDMSQEQAASVERVGRLYDRHAQNQAGSRRATPDEILNTAHGELTADVTTILREAHRQGWIDDDQRTEIREVFESARRHNKSLTDGGGFGDDSTVPMGLARIDELNAPAPFQAALRDLFLDIDTLSQAARKKNVTGPFERAGDAVGRVGSIGLAAAMTSGYGTATGIATALVGNPLAARIGASAGRMVDTALGSRSPAVLLARQKAQSILQKAGTEAGDSVDTVQSIRRLLTDERLSRRAAAGLPTDPQSVSRAAATSMWRRLSKGLQVDEGDLQSLLPDDQAWLLGRINEADEVAGQKAGRADAAELQRLAQEEATTREAAWPVERDRNVSPEAAWLQAERDTRITPAQREAQERQAWGQVEKTAASVDRQNDRQTAEEVGEWSRSLDTLRRAQRAMETSVRRDAETQSRDDMRTEQTLQAMGLADAAARRREVEEAYKQRDADERRVTRQRQDYDRAEAQREATKEAELAAMEADAATTAAQEAEWLQLLDARRARLRAAQQAPASAAPSPAAAPSEAPQPRPAAAAAAPTEAPVPAATPAARQATSETPRMPQGWNAGVMKHLWDTYRVAVSADDVEAALGRLEDRGLDADVADQARAGGRIDRRLMEDITQEAARAAGIDPRNPFASQAGAGPNGGENPVRNIHQWSGAKDSFQAAAGRAAEMAERAGDWDLYELVQTFGSTTETDLPGNVRVLRAKALIEMAPDVAAKARRRAALNPLITRYQKD